MTLSPAATFTRRDTGGYSIFADNGGPLPGSGGTIGNAAGFFGRRSVRDTWIALWVLWMFWALLFLARQMFGPTRVANVPRSDGVVSSNAPVGADQGPYDVQNGVAPSGGVGSGTATTGVAGHHGGTGRGGFFSRAVNNVRDRIDRTYDLLRDLTLMLFLVVTVNTFGLASGNTVLVLSWIYVAIALFWAGLIMLIESRILDLLLGSVQMLILLAILIVAYSMGWTVLG